MCGISGILSFNDFKPQKVLLEKMAFSMHHRGPDGQGIYIDDNVGFAHRRLAIIDPNYGHQPFVDTKEGIAITFNGEIYNYLELRDELNTSGKFVSNTDTEVLLKAYSSWGINCLGRLRGMFAFAIHDKKKNQVIIARDRLGIKPLYYCVFNGTFYFASEINALKIVIPNLEIDQESLASYFRWQYIPTPKSIYSGIQKLEPGNYLEINLETGNIKNNTYWSLKPETNLLPEKELLEELNAILDDIFKIYIRSDVPFGSFLSGGVDSSLVTALMQQKIGRDFKSFAVGFKEESHSELIYARQASNIIGTAHSEIVLSSNQALETLDSIILHLGEPFCDSSAIPTWMVSKVASKNVKMILSGDGGDELFGGYNSYKETFLNLNSSMPGYLKQKFYDLSDKIKPYEVFKGLSSFFTSPLNKHLNSRNIFTETEILKLTGHNIDTNWTWNSVLNCLEDDIDLLTKFQYLDVKTYLLDDILTKVDRMSMAHSLEVRVPLLDHKLVEFAFGLPLKSKISLVNGSLRTKHLLKLSAERFFSTDFLNRPKMGFGIPIVEWCQYDFKNKILDILGSSNSKIFAFTDQKVVKGIVNNFYAGKTELVSKLWSLFVLALWLELNFGKND